MPRRGGTNPQRLRSEFYRPYGGISIKHNGLGFAPRPTKVQKLPLRSRFDTGPTPRHAVLDLIRFVHEYPEVWDRL